MEGSNKNIKHEMPTSTCPKVSIVNDNLLALPSSHHGGSHIAVDAGSSETKTRFVQGSDALLVKDEYDSQINQNSILDTSCVDNSAKVVRCGHNPNRNMDPKVLRKVISNRLSAQKSRHKRAQYISDMEKKVVALQTLVAVLSPQVAHYEHQKYLLQMEKADLSQRITDCVNKELAVEAQIFERIEELKRLQQKQQEQEQNLLGEETIMDVGEDELIQEMMNPSMNSGTHEYTTTDVWEHELVKELMDPCMDSGNELTTDVWEHELSKELMMNPRLNSGTDQTMDETPNQVDAGENEQNENELHLKQENEH